ncbi:MAG: 4Fe-4S ferredoxin, partial [Bacteroidales bacterium]
CAKACPTKSILFGEIDDLRRVADERVVQLKEKGITDAAVYDPRDTTVKGIHAMFLLRGDVRMYNLPPAPQVPTALNGPAWRAAGATAALIAISAVASFAVRRRPKWGRD